MKKYTKALSLICALVLSLSFLTVVGIASGTGAEADPFIITTAEELQNINNNVTAHYILGGNIDLADMDFTPIGNADSGAFSGSFDGNGYKISNLNVFSGKYAGLFGSNEGVIKNVVLDNIYVYGTRYVGGVVGQNTTCGTVKNCKVISGLVESNGGIIDVNIGGICGINEGSFEGVFSNSADVSASSNECGVYAGGVCGYWDSETSQLNGVYNFGDVSSTASASYPYSEELPCRSGGIIGGVFSDLKISGYNIGRVFAYADVYQWKTAYAGGIVGEAYADITIINSYNKGEIISDLSDKNAGGCGAGGFIGSVCDGASINYCYNTGNVTGGDAGGIIGCGYYWMSTNISNCYNSGYIYGRFDSGGLVGEGGATINNSFNSGCVYGGAFSSGGLVGSVEEQCVIINNSYNTGNVLGDSTKGGLVGESYADTTITNGYNSGYLYGGAYNSGGLVGYNEGNLSIINSYSLSGCCIYEGAGVYGTSLSSDKMKLHSSFENWDFNTVWSTDGSINTGYPILKEFAPPLSLNISGKTMCVNETIQLVAYKNGVATSDIIWSVSYGESKISSGGLVTVGLGFSTITATDSEGNKANLNMYGYEKASALVATDRTVKLGSLQTTDYEYFTVLGSDTDYIVDWQSSNTKVLEIDSRGYITPVSVGTAIVTATTAGGVSCTQKVVVDSEATKIEISSLNVSTLNIGGALQLVATLTPSTSTNAITWTSSDMSIATVDSTGKVTGISPGRVVIIAQTDNGCVDTYTITVKSPVAEMEFENISITMYEGETTKLKLNISPINTTDTIQYTSSSTACATVSSTGVVTAVNEGTAVITATASSGKKAVCVITVKAWPSVFTVVDSTTTIAENIITTDTTSVRNLDKLVKAKDGYNIEVTYSHQTNGLNYYGTGTTIDVYDDYGNFVITYTLVVNGDVNGDSFVDVLDATATERMSTDAMTYDEPQAYAANGAAIETVDATSYQYVLNKALAE